MTTKKLPKNWSYCHLGEIIESRKGKVPTSFSLSPSKNFVPYIDIKFFERGITDRYAEKNDKCTLVTEDDVLVVWDGARFGLSTIGHSGALGSTILALRSNQLLPKFLYYFVDSSFKIIQSRPRGVGIPHVEPNLFWNLHIPLIPTNEQKRIVEKIEKLFKQIDSSVSTLQKTQEKISQFRDVIIRKQLFVPRKDFHYKQYPLGEALIYEQPTKYIVKSTKYNDSYKTPVLTPGKSFIKGYTNETFGIFEKDLPVIIFDDFTTASKFVTFPFKVKSSAMKILHINKEIANIQYIFYILSQIKDTKGTHKRYWISEYAPKLINLPLPTEQRKIVAEIEKQFAAADKMQKAVDNALENAKKLKQAILKKAFNGELVSQDPKDEPTAALLAKIKAEREASKHNLKQSKRTTK